MARAIAILALAAALVLAACGDEEPGATEAAETTGAAEQATTATTTPGGQTAEDDAAREGGGENRDGENGGGGPAATAEQAIRAVLTAAGDPAQACTEFVTQEFVATAYGGRANCVAARRPSALAESLQISDDGGGSFTAVPKGGPYDGVKVTVEVVDEGGYRVSSLLADIPAGP